MNPSKKNVFVAEMVGTMFIVLFGAGVNAMVVLMGLGDYTAINFGWGFAVFFGVLVSIRISGAHLNPAITIAFVITKKMKPHLASLYISAQMLGGFIGAAIVYIFFLPKFYEVDPLLEHTAGVFTTFPAIANTFLPGFIAEVTTTAILLFTILAMSKHFAEDNKHFVMPFAVGALIIAIGMSLGGMHGYAMNPARDFSPRLFVTLAGFKNNGLINSYVWMAPVFGSIVGGTLGTLLFDMYYPKK